MIITGINSIIMLLLHSINFMLLLSFLSFFYPSNSNNSSEYISSTLSQKWRHGNHWISACWCNVQGRFNLPKWCSGASKHKISKVVQNWQRCFSRSTDCILQITYVSWLLSFIRDTRKTDHMPDISVLVSCVECC